MKNATDMSLAGDLDGEPGHGPPLVLLHGLTFDRTMWRPALAELAQLDPGRQVLAVDLPGHGDSPAWPYYDLETIAEAVHVTAAQAGLRSPVLAGHSMGAVIATIYAARYPVRGVVNVDQPLRAEPFVRLAQSLAGQLRGPGFPAAWETFEASMGIGLLPPAAQELLRSSRHLRQDLVTGYWREALDRPPGELVGKITDSVAAVRAAGVPYQLVMGHELGPEELSWLEHMLPQASVTTWPGSGHFPHLAQPRQFAGLLAAAGKEPR